MRIIAGKYKGMRLKSPSERTVRPTLAKIREAFFDIIGPDIEQSSFLDLYAGTGAMGIEALSRGASMVYFVERSKQISTLLLKNLALIKDNLLDNNLYAVIKTDAYRALGQIKSKSVKIDIAYIDPPYEDSKAYMDILPVLINGEIMNKPFIIGVEHTGQMRGPLHSMINGMNSKTYKYGDKYLTVVRQY